MTPAAFQPVLGAAPWRFESPAALLVLLFVPVVAAMLWAAFIRRRAALRAFEGVTPQSTSPSALRYLAKITVLAVGLSSLTIALARPQADPVEESLTVRGRDIVFLVDVSRSMLSRDAVPNRLARAKLWINDLVNTLNGDRVALVAFAGAPVVKCPLTLDLGYFRMALDELSPASVPRGGTLIGDAIRKTLTDVFEPGEGRYRDIVLITDGEDQGSYPIEAAKKAAEMGVRLIVIGIGGELEGALVPAEDETSQRFVEYEGQKVRSRMDGSTLAKIAEAATQAGGLNGGGVFLNVGTGTMDLDKVYHDLVRSSEQRETETKSTVIYRELFPFFLGLAIVCFGVEPVIAGRKRLLRRRLNGRTQSTRSASIAVLVVVIASIASPSRAEGPTQNSAKPTRVEMTERSGTSSSKSPETGAKVTPPPAATPDALYNAGREMFLAGKYEEAAQHFRDSDLGTTDPELSARARFNLGQSLLKQATASNADSAGDDSAQAIARLDAAARAFRSALEAKPGDPDAARNVEISRRLMEEKQQEANRQQSQDQNQQNQPDQKDQKNSESKNGKGDSKQGESQQQQRDQSKEQSRNNSGSSTSNSPDGKANGGSESKQHQENADKLKELAQQQSQAADQSKEASQAEGEADKENQQRRAAESQSEVNDRTEKEREKLSRQGEQASKEAQDRLREAQRDQRAAAESLAKGDTKAGEEQQRRAAEKLRQAADAEMKAAGEAREKEAAEEAEKANQAAAKDEKPKFDDTASQLLDRERKQREARQQVLRALRGKPQPVEKDW